MQNMMALNRHDKVNSIYNFGASNYVPIDQKRSAAGRGSFAFDDGSSSMFNKARGEQENSSPPPKTDRFISERADVLLERNLFLLEPSPINPERVQVVKTLEKGTCPLPTSDMQFLVDVLNPLISNSFTGTDKGCAAKHNVDETRRIPQSVLSLGFQPLMRSFQEESVSTTSTGRSRSDTHVSFGQSDSTSKNGEEMHTSTTELIKKAREQERRRLMDDKWNERFQQLREFVQSHGHCHVPVNYAEDPHLSSWVKRQRYQYKLKQAGKHSTVSDERELMLGQLGFVWDAHVSSWDEKYYELLAYKKKYGDCNVQRSFAANPKLGRWVKCQRRQYSLYIKGLPHSITPERIAKLDAIGFQWVGIATQGHR